MAYLGTQPNDVKKNTGLYTPSEILQLTKDGSWGGSLEFIEELNPSSVQTIDSSELPTNYDVFKVDFNVAVSTRTANVHHIQFYESDVLETANVYNYHIYSGTPSGSFASSRSTTQGNLYLYNFGGNGSGGTIYFYNLRNSSMHSFYTFQTVNYNGAMAYGGGSLPQDSDVNKIRFKCSSSAQTLNSPSSYKIYGVKKI